MIYKNHGRPEPKIEPRSEPPAVARVERRPEPRLTPSVEPRPEPRPTPTVENRPEPRPEPSSAVTPEVKPIPREIAPPVVQPRIEPSVTAPTAPRALPSPPAVVQPPQVAAPLPKALDDRRERELTDQYQQIISAKIKRYENYPPMAMRNKWEGTTVVQLRFSPEGKVMEISVVEKSGHKILDEAAVKMIDSASPLPPPPEGVRTVRVPIKFRLDS